MDKFNYKNTVKIMLTHPKAKVPTYAKSGDAGADVSVLPKDGIIITKNLYRNYKNEMVRIENGDWIFGPHETKLLPLGFKVEIPVGYELQLRPRSGMAKGGFVIPNSPGTVDSGYRGEMMVLLKNDSPWTRVIKAGERIAQLCLKKAPQANYVLVKELSKTERGEGGFGSTGTK